MKIVIQNLLSALLIFSLTACHTAKQEKQYLQSQRIQPITIPSHLSSSSIESHYPIPHIQVQPPQQPVPINPPRVLK